MYKTTIVTAYFNLPKSKANHDTYTEWMQNMLIINNPMIIFCDPSSEEQLQNFRKEYLHITKIIPLEFKEFYSYKYFQNFVNDYNTKDHERYHNPYLYLIWNEKTNFLKNAVELNPFTSEYFLWVDIGCFRKPNTQYINWPNTTKINTLDKNKILLLGVNPFLQHEYNCTELKNLTDFKYIGGRIGGTIFGGTSATILKWHELYYEMLEYFIKIDRFIGKDQNIMNSIAVINKDFVQIINPDYFENDNRWFALQEYLNS